MRSALFSVTTQRRVVIPYPRLGTNYRSHLQGSAKWNLFVVPKRRYVITILRCVVTEKSADLERYFISSSNNCCSRSCFRAWRCSLTRKEASLWAIFLWYFRLCDANKQATTPASRLTSRVMEKVTLWNFVSCVSKNGCELLPRLLGTGSSCERWWK